MSLLDLSRGCFHWRARTCAFIARAARPGTYCARRAARPEADLALPDFSLRDEQKRPGKASPFGGNGRCNHGDQDLRLTPISEQLIGRPLEFTLE